MYLLEIHCRSMILCSGNGRCKAKQCIFSLFGILYNWVGQFLIQTNHNRPKNNFFSRIFGFDGWYLVWTIFILLNCTESISSSNSVNGQVHYCRKWRGLSHRFKLNELGPYLPCEPRKKDFGVPTGAWTRASWVWAEYTYHYTTMTFLLWSWFYILYIRLV